MPSRRKRRRERRVVGKDLLWALLLEKNLEMDE